MGLFFVVYLTSSRLNLGSHEASSWGATSPHVDGMAVPRNRQGSRQKRTGSDKGLGKGLRQRRTGCDKGLGGATGRGKPDHALQCPTGIPEAPTFHGQPSAPSAARSQFGRRLPTAVVTLPVNSPSQ